MSFGLTLIMDILQGDRLEAKMRGFNQKVAAQKEQIDALVDFRLDAQEDQYNLHKMLKQMNDELQEEKVRNQERFDQMSWQRQQDKRDYDELLDEYKRLLNDQRLQRSLGCCKCLAIVIIERLTYPTTYRLQTTLGAFVEM